MGSWGGRSWGWRGFNSAGIYNSLCLAMAEPALKQLAHWDAAELRRQLADWQEALRSALHANGLGHCWRHADSPHISAIEVQGNAAQLAARLHADGFVVAARGSALRVSPHVHSSLADAEAFAQALVRCIA